MSLMDAHSNFLASQAPLHPVLQHVQHMAGIYAQAPIVVDKDINQPELSDEIGKIAQEGVQESVSNEVFSVYRHREIVPGCHPHPGDIVEAGPLAGLPMPPAYYPIKDCIPEEVITSNKLSSLQLEGVIYACQRHQTILPNEQRAGFFIGDGAGVGKGRQISGIILDNYGRGRTKHIWFTISSDLIVDSRRDLADIGCYVHVIDGCQELDRETRAFGLSKDFKEGIVFSTYATLVSSVQKGGTFSSTKQSRLQQLVDWCGGEKYDGCLIFDECHKAKNFVPGKEHASTKVAIAVMTIQRMLPKARVLYCSATGVTDVKNMAFMERLGLWGEGAPFKSFEHFLESVQRKGLGMAEMLAMEMKATGIYVSRGLSFKQAEFVTVETSLDEHQRKMYNTAAHVWNELRKALDSALIRTRHTNNRIWAQFWSSHQRFFKQLCMGMKVPLIIKEAQSALENGMCVVIGLQTTGEASLESELGKNKGVINGFMSLCREILRRFIENFFPTKIQDAKGDESTEDDWSVAAKDMLVQFTKKIDLPDSPLDEIIDKLGGPDTVAEMTGRRGRIIRKSDKEQPVYEVRGADTDTGVESLNVKERNLFMEGRKLVAIISDAASTGISLHADCRAGNGRRRVHMTIELPWSADKAVQQLGRSHRSNQSSGPLYKLITTDLGGEKRFAAAVARRLQLLGALTKGDRRAASGADLAEFNFDTPYGRSALKSMYLHIAQKDLAPGVSLSTVTKDKYDFENFNAQMQECLLLMGLLELDSLRSGALIKDKDMGDVSKFLNRILGLSVEKQNMIFSYFSECMHVTVQNARKEGRYNEGMLDIRGSSVQVVGEPRIILKNLSKGYGSTKLVSLIIDRGISWEQAVVRAGNYNGKHDGFYRSKRETWGKHLFILATQKEGSTHLIRIARPNTGISVFDEELTDLMHKYSTVPLDKAGKHSSETDTFESVKSRVTFYETLHHLMFTWSQLSPETGWKEAYDYTKDHCIHGDTCRHGKTCTVGSRRYRLNLLTGNIVSIMSVLEATINRFGPKVGLTKSESNIRVVRVELDNGERIVGVRYPEILLGEVERTLKEQRMVERVQLQQSQTGEAQEASSSDNDVLAVKQSVTEDVAEVNGKCLAKALNPPVTIKTFFKNTAKQSDNDKSDGIAESELQNPSTADLTSCDDTNSSESKTVISPKKLLQHTGRKRKLDSSSNSKTSKKAKQASIFSAFNKQKEDKKSLENKKQECPICNVVFKPGTSNADINRHIDNCIIE